MTKFLDVPMWHNNNSVCNLDAGHSRPDYRLTT